MARTRSFVLMLDLHCDELVLQMFHCFIAVIRKHHPNRVKTDMYDILSMILDESDAVWEEKNFLEESTYDHIIAPVVLHVERIPSSSESAEWDVQCIEKIWLLCIETINQGIEDTSTGGISAVLISKHNICMHDFAKEEFQSQSGASSCKVEVFQTLHSPQSLWNQLKVNEDGIVAALSHHDEMHKLVENYLWMIQLERRQKVTEAESSLVSLQKIKEGIGTMKTNYLHLL
ncbi:hypothetical protein SUGI_1018040 [Cryptomeria japonica]|nr:hypothetical protein SUGI_1018040 [Cryptomeria japonica]